MNFTKALICCVSSLPVLAAAAAPLPQVQAESLIVKVSVNQEVKGDLFVNRTPDHDYLVRVEDLKILGLQINSTPTLQIDDETHVSLRLMPGVAFTFDEKTLLLEITARSDLLPKQALSLQGKTPTPGVVSRNNSVFFNYALSTAGSSQEAPSALEFAGEAGWRVGDFLALSNASSVRDAAGNTRFVRLMSSVTHDDRDSLQRIVAGDFFTPSRQFSNSVNLGGIGISKIYGLNPYLNQSPTQSISGSVASPSDLEIYLDGQKIRSEKINPGDYELKDILAYGGARNVKVVLRDAFGRVQELDYSFYFSDQPLRQGLHEYSYNLGKLRQNFGVISNDYGTTAASMFHRYGLNDAVTLGFRAEATKGFYSAGPSATVVMGSAGVVNLAFSASAMDNVKGTATSVSYSYQAQRWSVGTSLRKESGHFASLGATPTFYPRKFEGNVSGSYHLPGHGSVSLNHSAFMAQDAKNFASSTASTSVHENRRVTTLSYGAPLVSGRLSLQASLSHIKDSTSRNEMFVGLVYYPSQNYSVASNYQGNKQSNQSSLELTKTQPIGDGLGYNVAVNRFAGDAPANTLLNARLQYNAPFAIVRADFIRPLGSASASDSYRMSVAGGAAYLDGETAFGRPVTDSFGIVKVGDLNGVGVAVNGQPMGKTTHGKLFIPSLAPYYDNDVSIDPKTIPMEYAIPAVNKKISPSLRSGTLIDFQASKIQAFSGFLKTGEGAGENPVEFREIIVNVKNKPLSLITGRGGEFYAESILAGTHRASVQMGDSSCEFDLVIPQTEDAFVDLGTQFCRQRP